MLVSQYEPGGRHGALRGVSTRGAGAWGWALWSAGARFRVSRLEKKLQGDLEERFRKLSPIAGGDGSKHGKAET